MYVDYFADFGSQVTELDEIFAESKPIAKSDVISHKLREEGNIEFSKRNWSNAIKAYNYALSFAENGSEVLSQAYANRSACFFELDQFQSSLNDIDLALQPSECTEHIKQMIIQHRNDCTDFIRNNSSTDEDADDRVHSVFEPNQSIPSLSISVDVENQPGFGNCVMANCDIDVGQTISVETCCVSQLTAECYMRCCICLTKSNNLMPCQSCTKVMFCSDECQNNSLHVAECYLGEEIEGDGKLAFLIKTILYAVGLFRNGNEIMAFVEKCVRSKSSDKPVSMADDRSKYQHFLKLKSDTTIVQAETPDPLIYFAFKAIMATNVKKMFSTKKLQRFLVHLIWQHDAIISLGHVHQYTNREQKVESLHLSLTFSLFSHSCTANAMRYLAGNQLIIVAIRPIKKGEIVTVSYFDKNCFKGSVEEREQYLDAIDDTFGMKCSCDLCKDQTITSLTERDSMKEEPTYKHIFVSSYQHRFANVPMNTNEMRRNATAFLRKFGQSKWCKELEVVTACFMDAMWRQSIGE